MVLWKRDIILKVGGGPECSTLCTMFFNVLLGTIFCDCFQIWAPNEGPGKLPGGPTNNFFRYFLHPACLGAPGEPRIAKTIAKNKKMTPKSTPRIPKWPPRVPKRPPKDPHMSPINRSTIDPTQRSSGFAQAVGYTCMQLLNIIACYILWMLDSVIQDVIKRAWTMEYLLNMSCNCCCVRWFRSHSDKFLCFFVFFLLFSGFRIFSCYSHYEHFRSWAHAMQEHCMLQAVSTWPIENTYSEGCDAEWLHAIGFWPVAIERALQPRLGVGFRPTVKKRRLRSLRIGPIAKSIAIHRKWTSFSDSELGCRSAPCYRSAFDSNGGSQPKLDIGPRLTKTCYRLPADCKSEFFIVAGGQFPNGQRNRHRNVNAAIAVTYFLTK